MIPRIRRGGVVRGSAHGLRVARVLAAAAAAAVLVGAGVARAPGAAAAQTLPPAGARTLGLSGLGTAAPAGAESVSLNPATAALPGAPRFALTILPGAAGWNLDPVGLGDLADVAGTELSQETREQWMGRIEERGGFVGGLRGNATGIALTAGTLGVQVTTSAHGFAGLSPDAAELLLFGNAGRTGVARDMTLDDSRLDGAAYTTVAVSWALRVDSWLRGFARDGSDGLAVGVRASWSVGHALLLGRDLGSRVTADPLGVDLAFPVVYTEAAEARAGDGFALALAAAWTSGAWSLGAVLHDAMNTFEWSEERLVFRAGEALLEGNGSVSDFEPRPFADAPVELRDRVRDWAPSPRLSLGAAWRPRSSLALVADVSRTFGEDPSRAARTRFGLGADYRALRWLALRGGVQAISGGMRLGGGVGFDLGPVDLSLGALHRTGTNRGDTTLGASLTILRR